jgi:hypothetical protein
MKKLASGSSAGGKLVIIKDHFVASWEFPTTHLKGDDTAQ